MQKGDGDQALGAVRSGQGEGSLEEALSAYEVGLEARTEGIAAPGDPGGARAGAAHQGIIEHGADGSLGRELRDHGAADEGEDGLEGKTLLREETVAGAPVLELRAGSGEQTSHGMASQAEQRAQREGLGALGEASLVEAGEALAPELFEMGEDTGRVFFRTEGGGLVRRRARRPLLSTNHSTVSPRENSMAWATAEGKLMYHCSLAWRLISWTLVGNPMGRASFRYLVIQLDTRRQAHCATTKFSNGFV
jgi:hypothetical protein